MKLWGGSKTEPAETGLAGREAELAQREADLERRAGVLMRRSEQIERREEALRQAVAKFEAERQNLYGELATVREQRNDFEMQAVAAQEAASFALRRLESTERRLRNATAAAGRLRRLRAK